MSASSISRMCLSYEAALPWPRTAAESRPSPTRGCCCSLAMCTTLPASPLASRRAATASRRGGDGRVALERSERRSNEFAGGLGRRRKDRGCPSCASRAAGPLASEAAPKRTMACLRSRLNHHHRAERGRRRPQTSREGERMDAGRHRVEQRPPGLEERRRKSQTRRRLATPRRPPGDAGRDIWRRGAARWSRAQYRRSGALQCES